MFKLYEFSFQLLLLNDLYDTRMCHALLVPEADEEVSWKLDRVPKPKQEHSANSSSEYIIDGCVKYIGISPMYIAASSVILSTLKATNTTAADDIHKHIFIVLQRK